MKRMEDPVRKVRLDEPGLEGDYLVAEVNPDGTVVLAPDTSVEAMLERAGATRVDDAEFDKLFVDLPRDGEG